MSDTLSPQELVQAHGDLMRFVHLAPVGLVQTNRHGDIQQINPKAVQLLAPLGLAQGELNFLKLLDAASSDLRTLLHVFAHSSGVICENHRIELPASFTHPDGVQAFGLTVLMLDADRDSLMVVITDETHALKLQRLQAQWQR